MAVASNLTMKCIRGHSVGAVSMHWAKEGLRMQTCPLLRNPLQRRSLTALDILLPSACWGWGEGMVGRERVCLI